MAVEDVSRARTLAQGQAAPSMTSSQILQNIETRADSADLLQLSDLSVYVATDSGVVNNPDRTVTCSGVACTFSLADDQSMFRVSLNDLDAYPIFTDTRLTGVNTASSVVMIDNGVTLVQGRSAARQDAAGLQYQSYGGWLSNSFFGVEGLAVVVNNSDDPSVGAVGWVGAYSFGNDSETNPSGSGSAVWNGVVVGASEMSGEVIHGDAMIDIDDLSSPNVDVEFTSIRNLDTRATVSDMTWTGLTVTGGAFSDASGTIEGVFYGAGHEEVGGIFNRNSILGAFGAERQ